MATNKIIYGNQTLIDLTGDTVTASDVASGKTFHGKDGVQTTGTATAPTHITPSFSAPAMTIGNTYAPTANGYAIDTYYNVTPSSAATVLSSGYFYKMNSNGYLIDTYNGVITPSEDDSGTYFPSGFVKMSSSGYAYQNKPSGGMTETVLWTNSNPTASTGFAAQNVSLSDNINNYDFIAVKCAHGIQTAQQSNYSKAYFKVSDYIVSYVGNGSPVCSVTFLYLKTNRTMAIRHFWYIDDYTLHFEVGTIGNSGGSSSNNQYAIPLYVYGCK